MQARKNARYQRINMRTLGQKLIMEAKKEIQRNRKGNYYSKRVTKSRAGVQYVQSIKRAGA